MKHCTDCKWYDPLDEWRQSAIRMASNEAANAIISFAGTHIEPMEDDEIRALQIRAQLASHELEDIYAWWERYMPPTCGHSMVVRPEDGKVFDHIHQAREFCGYKIPKHWEKQTEVAVSRRMEAYEKTFEIIKIRFRQERSVFQRIKNWFGI